jgi:hypothetical protein
VSRGTAQSRRGRYEMKGCLGAFRQTCTVASSPESVFDPPNLGDWQTSKTRVEVLSEGEPRAGIPGAGVGRSRRVVLVHWDSGGATLRRRCCCLPRP